MANINISDRVLSKLIHIMRDLASRHLMFICVPDYYF